MADYNNRFAFVHKKERIGTDRARPADCFPSADDFNVQSIRLLEQNSFSIDREWGLKDICTSLSGGGIFHFRTPAMYIRWIRAEKT
jgi:hypothetical protein